MFGYIPSIPTLLPFATVWIDLKNIMLSEIRQSEKKITAWFHSYVESNEQTEKIYKIETDSWIVSRMTAKVLETVEGGGIEHKGKRTRGHGQQFGDCMKGRSIRGQNGNGKNTIKKTKK